MSESEKKPRLFDEIDDDEVYDGTQTTIEYNTNNKDNKIQMTNLQTNETINVERDEDGKLNFEKTQEKINKKEPNTHAFHLDLNKLNQTADTTRSPSSINQSTRTPHKRNGTYKLKTPRSARSTFRERKRYTLNSSRRHKTTTQENAMEKRIRKTKIDKVETHALSIAGSNIWSAERNGRIHIFSALDGHHVADVKNKSTIAKMVNIGNEIWVGTGEGQIQIWDRRRKTLKTILGERHSGIISDMLLLKITNNRGNEELRLVTSSTDFTIRIWDVAKKKTLYKMAHLKFWVNSLTAMGNIIVSGSDDSMLSFWSLDGKLNHSFKAHSNGITNVKYDPVSDLLWTSGRERKIKIWSSDGELIKTIENINVPPHLMCIAGDHVFIGHEHQIEIRSLKSSKSLLVIHIPGYVYCMEIIRTSVWIACSDKTIRAYSISEIRDEIVRAEEERRSIANAAGVTEDDGDDDALASRSTRNKLIQTQIVGEDTAHFEREIESLELQLKDAQEQNLGLNRSNSKVRELSDKLDDNERIIQNLMNSKQELEMAMQDQTDKKSKEARELARLAAKYTNIKSKALGLQKETNALRKSTSEQHRQDRNLISELRNKTDAAEKQSRMMRIEMLSNKRRLMGEVQSLKTMNNKLEDELKPLRDINEHFKSLKEAYDSLQDSLQTIKDEKKSLSDNYENYQDELLTLREENANVKEKLQEVEDSLMFCQAEHAEKTDELEAKLESLKERKSILQSELTHLKDAFEDVSELKEKIKSELDAKRTKEQQLLREVSTLKQDLFDRQSQYDNEINEEKDRVKDLESQIQNLMDMNVEAKQTILELEDQCRKHSSAAENKHSAIAQKDAEIEKIKEQLKDLETEKQQLIESHANALKQAEDDFEKRCQRIKDNLQNEIDSLKENHQEIIDQLNHDHDQQLLALKSESKHAFDEKEKMLKDQLDMARSDAALDLKNEQAAHQKALENVNAQLTRMKEEHEKVKQNYETLYERVVTANEENESLREKLEKAESSLLQQSSEKDTLEEETERLKATYEEKFAKQQESANAEYASLKQDMQSKYDKLLDTYNATMEKMKEASQQDKDELLLSSQSEISQLKRRHDEKIQTLKDEHETALKQLTEEHQEGQDHLRSLLDTITKEHEDELAKVQASLEEKENEMTSMFEEKEENIMKFESKSNEYQLLQEDYQHVVDTNKELTDRIAHLESQHQTIAADHEKALESLKNTMNEQENTLHQKMDKLVLNEAAYQEEIEQLRSSINSANASRDDLSTEIASSLDELSNAKKQVEHLQGDNDELTTKLNTIEKTLNDRDQTSILQEKEIQRTEQQLKEKEKALETLQQQHDKLVQQLKDQQAMNDASSNDMSSLENQLTEALDRAATFEASSKKYQQQAADESEAAHHVVAQLEESIAKGTALLDKLPSEPLSETRYRPIEPLVMDPHGENVSFDDLQSCLTHLHSNVLQAMKAQEEGAAIQIT